MTMNLKELIPWYRDKDGNLLKNTDDNPFLTLQREMNQMFDSFSRSIFDDSSFFKGRGSGMVSTKMDVKETDKNIQVTLELPGIEEKDIDVNVTKDLLTIKGEKQAEKDEKKEGYHLIERSFGSFHRSVPLPPGVETDQVKANFKNGVLKITLPKSEEAQKETKKVEISSD